MNRGKLVHKLDIALHQFREKPRDIVFLVDQSEWIKPNDLEKALCCVFDRHINDSDRVSLIKFGLEWHTSTVFSLVRKDLNMAQLRT